MRSILMTSGLAPDRLVLAALLFFTGMREGEACGRRWQDWDPNTKPLGVSVHDQYDGQPLKTDQPRVVPMHPDLAKIRPWWKAEGFELLYCQPPHFIVPHRDGLTCHTKSSAYESWRKMLDQAGVTNHSMHSTRHTFISLCRRAGARKDVLGKVTHKTPRATSWTDTRRGMEAPL